MPVPASLGLRAVAGLIDWLLLGTVTAPLGIAPVLELTGDNSINASIRYSRPRALDSLLWVTLAAGAFIILYYGLLLEGRWGRSLGKRICGLEVVAKSGEPAGIRRAMLRVLMFVLPYWIVIVPKVVAAVAGATGELSAAGWRGEALYWGGVMILGFDSALKRHVWLHRLPSGAAAVLLLWLYVWAWSAAGRDLIDTLSNWWVPAAAAVAAVAGCVWAILHPAQGVSERLTRTYLVPRWEWLCPPAPLHAPRGDASTGERRL